MYHLTLITASCGIPPILCAFICQRNPDASLCFASHIQQLYSILSWPMPRILSIIFIQPTYNRQGLVVLGAKKDTAYTAYLEWGGTMGTWQGLASKLEAIRSFQFFLLTDNTHLHLYDIMKIEIYMSDLFSMANCARTP